MPQPEDLPILMFALGEIVRDPEIQVRDHLDESTIVRYMETFSALPPIDIFVDGPDGDWLLADGFHRVEAAFRLGRVAIMGHRHEGDRAAAIAFAALANMTHGLPLTRAERNRAIVHLSTTCGWVTRKIAAELNITHQTVSYVLSANKVRAVTIESLADICQDDDEDAGLSDNHYERIARAPKEYWQWLVTAALEQKWNRDKVIEAVVILKNSHVSEADRQALLMGEAQLEDFQEDGTRLPSAVYCRECGAVHRPSDPHGAVLGLKEEPRRMAPQTSHELTFGDVKAEVVAEAEPYETAARLRRLLYALDVETRVEPELYVEAIPAETRQRLVTLSELVIERLTNLHRALAAGSPLRELVRP